MAKKNRYVQELDIFRKMYVSDSEEASKSLNECSTHSNIGVSWSVDTNKCCKFNVKNSKKQNQKLS